MKIRKSTMALLAAVMILPMLEAADTDTTLQRGQPKTQEQRTKDRAARDNMTFDEMKAKMSASIEKRAAEVKIAQECVNNATTKEQLQACRPPKKIEKKQITKPKQHQ